MSFFSVFLFKKFLLSTVDLQCCQFLLYSKVNQLHVFIQPLFLGFPFHLGHYRTLSSLYCTVGSHQLSILYIVEGTPLQYSCLENPMDRGGWQAAVHGVAKSWTQLSDFAFTFYFHAQEKEMATHSSVLAWRIPGMGEPGVLPSMGSHRVGHN